MLTYFTYNWSVGLIYNNVYVHVYERTILELFNALTVYFTRHDVQSWKSKAVLQFAYVRPGPSKKKVQDFICVRQTLTRFLYPKKVNSNADQSSYCPVVFQERFQL